MFVEVADQEFQRTWIIFRQVELAGVGFLKALVSHDHACGIFVICAHFEWTTKQLAEVLRLNLENEFVDWEGPTTALEGQIGDGGRVAEPRVRQSCIHCPRVVVG